MIFVVSLGWALFQLWYASPLPFTFGIGILNDTEARALHLGLALFLAFMRLAGVRALAARPRAADRLVLALVGAFAGAYLLLFYSQLATRPGQPTTMDIAVSGDRPGCCCSKPRAAPSAGRWRCWRCLFIAYAMLGPYMPEVLSHKGASLNRLLSHLWLTTEGVYGIALGVSTGDDLRLRALRHPARPRRRRQLHDAGQLCRTRPPAGRAGQGGGGVVGAQRHDQRQLGQQRRQRRHLHDPADEEGRLRRREGRRDRDHELGQRPDHAAGDGRGRLPDGGVRRHPLQRDREERDPAGHAELHRAALHRAPRGTEAEHAPTRPSPAADLGRGGTAIRPRAVGQRAGGVAAVLPAGGHQGRPRRGRPLGGGRGGAGALRRQPAAGGSLPRPARGHRRRKPQPAGHLAHGARRAALPDPHRHAHLVPDGGGDVARAVGLLGHRRR